MTITLQWDPHIQKDEYVVNYQSTIWAKKITGFLNRLVKSNDKIHAINEPGYGT